MADPAEGATRIHLARSIPRLLATPIALGVAGAAAIAVGLLVAGGTLGLVLAGLGGILVVAAVAVAILLLSVHVEVEEAAVRLVWFGGHRRYPLVPGPVTRVPLRGPRASKLRPRLGALGWGIGSARLRDEEDIELIRLAPTPSAILIPTERGRVAIAAAREDELLEALARAAHARQRQELADAAPEPEPAIPAPAADADLDMVPTSLTGIERALLEERLGRERAEAERVAREARIAAAMAETQAAGEALPSEADAPARDAAEPGRRGRAALRPRASWVLALVPTMVAVGIWWISREVGALPPAGTDVARLTSLGLVLAGPATSIGAVMALAWWPRLVGLVVVGGLAASVLIGRSLVG
jgi:hypothetical protein